MESSTWNRTGRTAWTEHDGPGRPPSGVPRWYTPLVAAALGTSLAVVIGGDALCPEHRVVVRALGVIGLALCIGALVSALRWSAASPSLTVGAAITGLALAAVDAAHSPLRGTLVMTAFACALLLASVPLAVHVRAVRWANRASKDMAPMAALFGCPPFTAAEAEPGVLEDAHR